MLLAGCAAAPPLPPGTPAFGLMGDTPYSVGEVERLDRLIDDMNAADLAFVVHVGDITSGLGPCTDDWFQARKKQFARLRHPFILLPGDNDWTDCHRTGFDPVERLQHWRSLFCFTEKMPVERQAGPYCEHVRWESAGYLFVALDVQGSNNNRGRTAAMDREYEERMKAVDAWIDDAVRAFEARKLKGLVLMMQANPFLTPRSGPSGFTGIVRKLKALGMRHPLQVVLVNGDTHTYRDDVPLPGVRRIEVPGSPFVDWLRAAVVNGELHVVPAGGR